MTEEENLFKKEKRAVFYRKIIVLAKKTNLLFLYFCILMNLLVIGMIVLADFNVGIVFFVLNTWFLIILRLKLKSETKNV